MLEESIEGASRDFNELSTGLILNRGGRRSTWEHQSWLKMPSLGPIPQSKANFSFMIL